MELKGKMNHNGKTWDEVSEHLAADEEPMVKTIFKLMSRGSREPDSNKKKRHETMRLGYMLGIISTIALTKGREGTRKELNRPSNLVEEVIAMAEDKATLLGFARATRNVFDGRLDPYKKDDDDDDDRIKVMKVSIDDLPDELREIIKKHMK